MLGNKSHQLICILVTGLTAMTAQAHPMSTSDNKLFVTIPELPQGYEVSLTALALQPGASNLNYVIYNKELPAQSPTWKEKEITPGFGPAFNLGFRAIEPEGKDINLEWTHLNTNDSTSLAAPNDQYFLGPDYQIGPDGLEIRNATGSAQFIADIINLDVGQLVDFGQHTTFRFFGGLSNTYLREDVHSSYAGNVVAGEFPGPFSTKQKISANFTGIGPRIGLEGRYHTDYGIGFVGKAAVSALIGSSYAKTDFVSSAVELLTLFDQAVNYQFIEDKRIYQVIPGIDTKLGVYYHYQINDCSTFSMELGYLASVYINAIQQYIPASLAQPLQTGGIFVDTMSHTQSNYSMQGPYLSASFQF